MKAHHFYLLFYFIGSIAMGQTNLPTRLSNLMQRAESYRIERNYIKAIDLYEEIIRQKSDCHEAIINIADSYFKLKEYEKTMIWYDAAQQYKKLSAEEGYQYTNALMILGKYDQARQWLNAYLLTQPDDIIAKEKLSGLESITTFYKDSSRYRIRNLPSNSDRSEFSPIQYQQGILMVANTHSGTAKDKSASYLELCYYSLEDSIGVFHALGEPINTKLHEGPATLYDGERKMIFTRNHKAKKQGKSNHEIIHFQLFFSEKDKNDRWKDPVMLSINDQMFSSGHPTITHDGQTLYFSSNREGGYGGSDLYKSLWINNEWSKPENLGANINTSGNEMFPYIFKDSILYFASDGYQSLGGLDIYKTNLRTPGGIINLGYPINSRDDDFSICIYLDEKKGFFASARKGGKGNDDIYEFVVNDAKEALLVVTKSEAEPIKIYYTVQILALRNPKLVNRAFMKQLKGVVRHKGKDGIYRYIYGEYEGAADALGMLQTIRAMGYEDAFIRKLDLYNEMSEKPGENTDALYEAMVHDHRQEKK